MMIFPKIIITAALGVAGLASAQSMYATSMVGNCTWQDSLMLDSIVGMYCNNNNWIDFDYNWTWLDMNACLTNYNGQLLPYDSGNYYSTCNNCSIRPSPVNFVLYCECLNSHGQFSPTTFDLNTLLYNRDGALGCFEHMGNKTRQGPF